MASKWFSVKIVLRGSADGRPGLPDFQYDPDATLVEERVQLIKASGAREAEIKARKLAADETARLVYENEYGQTVRFRVLRTLDVFPLSGAPADKVEVFSASRIMSRKINDAKLEKMLIPRREIDPQRSKFKKFIKRMSG